MVKLGLLTLELMIAELKRPAFAGDFPVTLNHQSENDTDFVEESDTVAMDQEYMFESKGCGGECDGDCSCGGQCGGDCQHEMHVAPGPVLMMDPIDDPTGDRDRTKDRAPLPNRKKLPWGIGIAS